MEEVTKITRDFHIKTLSYLLQWIKWFSLGCFNWPETKSYVVKFIFAIIMASCIAIIIMQHVFIFQNSDNLDWIIGAYFTMIAVIIYCVKALVLYYKRKKVLQLMNIIRNEFWPLNSFDQFDKYWPFIKLVKILSATYCINALFITQILMYFPYIDKLPNQRVMPILSWYPFDVNISPVHEITYLWISSVGVFVGFGIPSFDSLFFYFQFNTMLQFRLLKHAFVTINTKYGDTDSEENLYKKLVFCIKYHQKLIKFYYQAKDVYEIHNAFNLFTAGVTVCLLTYLIQNETDAIKSMKLEVYYFCAFLNLTIYCVTGSLIESETEDLPLAIYKTGWEKQSKRFRKAVLFMIKIAQIPRNITAGKLITVGNMTLISVFKTAFSISVFLSSKKNEV